jgi:hypothetical protein
MIHRGFTSRLLVLALFLVSCDESGLNDFPYIERMVVAAVLDAGTDSVLPVSEVYTPENSVLSGVTGRVMHGAEAFPLVQIVPGIYQAQGLRVDAGETYELEAEWQGKSVRATTRVPFPPSVIASTADLDSTGDGRLTLTTVVGAASPEVYGQTWSTRGPSGSDSGGVFTSIQRFEDADANGNVSVSEVYHLSVAPTDTLYAVVYAFDRSFYDWFISRGGNIPGYDDLLFRQVGGSVTWNVEGDGIGMFLGRASSRVRADVR